MKATPSRASIVLLAWMVLAQWRAQPGRMLASVLAIAVGVCVGLAIHLVNRSALDEFAGALAVVNGEAQARLVAIGSSIDELAYDRASQDPAIEAASPVIETRVLVRRIGTDEAPGRSTTLPLIAIDPMRAAAVTPALVPALERSSQAPDRFGGLFAPDAVFLSAAALAILDVRLDDTVRVVAGGAQMRARVAGRLDGAAAGQALIVMDIATAQWRLGWLGRLSRIDLRLREGADREALARRVAADPARWRLVTPDASASRMSSLSRAYRVNLNVLALVALFTGAFIVQSTLSLAVIRQQAQLALLGVLGASRRLLLAVVLLQGVWLGTIGAVFGIVLGLGLAALLLSAMGGDLGGGYFDQSVPTLSIDLPATLAIGVLGVAAGTTGALVPALGIARQASAAALRAGAGEAATSMRPAIAIGIAAAIAASALMQLPPIAGLPLGAYAAIACVLIGGIALTGPLLRACTAMLARFGDSLWRLPPMWLGALRPMRAPRAAARRVPGSSPASHWPARCRSWCTAFASR
ncbi:MAG: FtsX-like permease family protein [Burkholderiaceae bacterium]